MAREAVTSDKAPKAIGPYSQAVKAGGFLFLSGQVALDPATMTVVAGDVGAQTERVLDNLEAVLAAAGLTFRDVARTTIYLKDMNHFGEVNERYGKRFTAPYPARATVEVARLPKDVLVEIDAIAVCK